MQVQENEQAVVFTIDPEPTFWAPVDIPMAGGKKGCIHVLFRYKDREQYAAFFDEHKGERDDEVLPLLIEGWEGPDAPYSAETLGRLLRNYPQAGVAMVAAYRDELFGAAVKN